MIIGHRNSESYDEFMTKLRQTCDDFMIIIIFFENMATDAFLACLFICSLFNIFVYVTHMHMSHEYIWK